MARTSYNLLEVIAYAKDNGLDVSNLEQAKENFREYMERETSGSKEKKRSYTKKHGTMFVILPNGKDTEVKTIPNVINNTSELLVKAYALATEHYEALQKQGKVKKGSQNLDKFLQGVTMAWCTEINMMEAIARNRV